MVAIEGIIVKSIKYKENSKIIYIITKDGLETLLSKGSTNPKSHNFSYSQELTKISFESSVNKGNSFKTLTIGKIINNYSKIKTDSGKLTSALKVIELAYEMISYIDNKELLYSFLDEILGRINDFNKHYYYSYIFKLKLLYLLGVGPKLSSCVDCGTKESLKGFVFASGGMKCKNCLTKDDSLVNDELIDIIKFLYLTKLKDFKNEDFDELEKYDEAIKIFIKDYYNHYLSFDSKVDKVLKKMKVK